MAFPGLVIHSLWRKPGPSKTHICDQVPQPGPGWGVCIMLIPSLVVAISAGLAGIAWLFFARSQVGRHQGMILAWLCIPFFAIAGIYICFSVHEIAIDIRAVHARIGIMAISISQAIILFILSRTNRGKHG